MNSKRTERIIDELNLMDDYFMTRVFDNNVPAAERVLNIILNKNNIKIIKIQVQKNIKSSTANGRSIIFDVNAEDFVRNIYDLEFQKRKNGAGRKRSRFYSGVLDSQMLKSGQKFSDLKESYVIFITETDVMEKGLPLYHVERSILETNEPFNDGNHIIYVNGAYDDETTPVGKLIHDLKCTKADDMYYKELRDAVKYFKEDEGGRADMCKAMEDFARENWRNGRKAGKKEGKNIGRIEGRKFEQRNTVKNMHLLGFDVKTIASVVKIPEKTIEEWLFRN